MSDDLTAGGLMPSMQFQPSKDDLIAIAQKAIDNAHNEIRRTADGGTVAVEIPQQQPGVTVDLCHKRIVNLPEEVLQLPALEILDLSRNRIRSVPGEIRHMTSLKVLALQRNLIERLPTCLGDMSTLRVLKVNENPLTFPPQNVCTPDDEQVGLSAPGDKAMIAVTQKIKRYLRDYAGQTPKARTVFAESDGELSESSAETPRPFRPMGTRFPVRPSLSGTDSMIIPSTSPEPPPIPSKSHERMRSNQLPISRKNTLLSPPESNLMRDSGATLVGDSFDEPGSEVTVRPKRHGMITPRGPEGAAQQMALSPSALQEAFSDIGSRPPSRAGSARSNSSLSSENIIDISKITYNTAGDLYRRLYSLRGLMEQNQTPFRARLEVELQAASLRADALQKAVSLSPKENTYQPHRHVLKPLVECLVSISSLSRLMTSLTPLYCRSSSRDSFRQTFWSTQRDIWELAIANFQMSDVLKSVNHSRQTSTSSQYLGTFQAEIPRLGHNGPRFDNGYMVNRTGQLPSPTGSAFSTSHLQNGNSNISASFSPMPAPLNIQPRPTVSFTTDTSYGMREDEMRQEIANDALWEEMCRILHNMCEVTVDNLSKVQAHYRNERQRALRQLDQDHDIVKQLGSLVNRCNVIMESSNTLARRLESLTPTDRTVRHSLDFWAYPRTVFLEWWALAQRIKQLPRKSNTDIMNIMRPIQQLIKGASRAIENSPWAVYMQKSNHNVIPDVPQLRQNQGGPPAGITINTHQPNTNSVPSTPLSAALGPAAAAALPSKGGMGRPTINFFERADRYASATNQRQAEVIYTKRSGA